MDEQQRSTFLAVNSVLMPLWLAMIVAPRSRMTQRLMRTSTPLLAGLSATYGIMLAHGLSSADTSGSRQFDVDQLRAALATPEGFVTGWTHYLVLDFFLGRWIWQTALDEDRGCRLALTGALMAGPLGFLIFTIQRRLRPA